MPPQKFESPDTIIPRKAGVAPGQDPEKGLITLPGESEYEPEELAGGTYLTTRLDAMVNWARGNSLWPLPFGTACCAIEFMSMVSSHYDIARFGAEVVRFSPRQADLMIVAGWCSYKMAHAVRRIAPDAIRLSSRVADIETRGSRVAAVMATGDRIEAPSDDSPCGA